MDDTFEKKTCTCKTGLSRRSFFTSVGVGAVAFATAKPVHSQEKPQVLEPDSTEKIRLVVNGREHRILVEPRWTLLFVLREKLGLTGTKMGCERGECGACTVLINDIPQYACLKLAVESEGYAITTLEGLMNGENLGPVQQAFLEKDAYQCGYCTPGQIMAVEGLLRQNASPTMEQIKRGVSGNLCRCGAYKNIFDAADLAAKLKTGGG